MSSSDTATASQSQALATVDEQMKNKIDLQRLREWTVKPGVIRLPVDEIATAANSSQWSITLEHPTRGDIQFFVDEPVTDDPDSEFNTLLEWYGITNNNPYHLQTRKLCVSYDKETERRNSIHGTSNDAWSLVQPPQYDPPSPDTLRGHVRARLPSISVSRWASTHASVNDLTVMVTTVLGPLAALVITTDSLSVSTIASLVAGGLVASLFVIAHIHVRVEETSDT